MDKPLIKFYDTSALLGNAPISENCFISATVVDELEKIKYSSTKDENTKYKARKLVRKLMLDPKVKHHVFKEKDIQKLYKKYDFLAAKNDSRIICEALLLAKKYEVHFITKDACQYLIAKEHFPQLHVEYWADGLDKQNMWKGFRELILDDDEMSYLYSHPEQNAFDLITNEYATIASINTPKDIVDIIKWNGESYEVIKYKKVRSEYFGKISPRNPQQEMYFDLLQNHNITVKVVRGGFGTGKTMLALIHAIDNIQNGRFKKLVFVRNNVEVAGSRELGALPGLTKWLY